MLHILRPKIIFAAFIGAARINMVEHHTLGEQFGKRLIDIHQPQIAHHLGPKARIQEVQYRVLDAADVLVHRRPIGRSLGHHGIAIVGVAIAHVVPTRIDKGIHGVGLAPGRFAAHRAGHTRMKTFVLVQRVARAIRNAIERQHHR